MSKYDLLNITNDISSIEANVVYIEDSIKKAKTFLSKSEEDSDEYQNGLYILVRTRVSFNNILITISKLVVDQYIDPEWNDLVIAIKTHTEDIYKIHDYMNPRSGENGYEGGLQYAMGVIENSEGLLDEIDKLLLLLIEIQHALESLEKQNVTVLEWDAPAKKVKLIVPAYGMQDNTTELSGMQVGAFLVHDGGALTHIITGGRIASYSSNVVAAYVARMLTEIVPDGDITALRANKGMIGTFANEAMALSNSRMLHTRGGKIGMVIEGGLDA